ncbi:MAG TPA: polymer-forming cytoskeletal protein [Myxococcota bacterium]|nr:polymer-forming cytoskeletal protein [Myxococcota bacterium]
MDAQGGTGWRRLVPGARLEEPAAPAPEAESVVREPNVAVIARGVEMSGRLVVPNSLVVEGEFSGELEIASSVVITESGAVTAPIRARSVEIRGAVMGDIVATREVVIHSTGRLHGDVETPSLVIARGATFNGRTRMYRPEHALQSPAPQPETRA